MAPQPADNFDHQIELLMANLQPIETLGFPLCPDPVLDILPGDS